MLVAWLALAGLTSLPYLVHSAWPPRGALFQGFLYFVGDHYLYLSYARQAQEGRFFFHNKLVVEDHAPGLVNLEWWLVGNVSRVLGGRPFLAYRIFGVLATGLLLVVVARLLLRAGLAQDRLLPSLLLIGTGGGLGGILVGAGWLPPERCLDVSTGLFPFLGLLTNAHFTIGSALLLSSLLWFEAESRAGQALALALGAVLALVRPYDFVTLVALRLGSIGVLHPWRDWLRRALPLVSLLPAVLWNYWVFYRNPAFAFYAKAPYAFPASADLLLALAPAACLAALALRTEAPTPAARATRLLLLLWCGFGACVIAARPVFFSLQFLVGLGLPILAFAALGLARLPRTAAWLALLFLSSPALFALQATLQPLPFWFTSAERMRAAQAMEPLCREGDVAFAPPDIGLFVAGLSSCKAYVSHVSHPAYAERVRETEAFYAAIEPDARARLLERACARHVVLPGDAGAVPAAWLGPETPFRRSAAVGAPPRLVSIYSRPEPPACGP